MQRSLINALLKDAEQFFADYHWRLPKYASWTPSQLAGIPDDSPILLNRLGWDVTDYGGGDFHSLGLLLFTVRNGVASDQASLHSLPYAEKIMISGVNQICPMHRHERKVEDIINRGGGNLVMKLFASNPDGSPDPEASFEVFSDGQLVRVAAGEHFCLKPGQSITLHPGIWHEFWAEGSQCLVGEISTINDDYTDNVFLEDIPRFTNVDEDESPHRLLVSDYDQRALLGTS